MRHAVVVLLTGSLALVVAYSSAAGSPQFALVWGAHGLGPGQFDRPVAVAVNSGGEVYVGDSRQRYVQRFTSNGQFLGWCANNPPSVYCPIAMALAVDPRTDRVFASDPTQLAIQVYSRDLVPITGWSFGIAYGIAIGPTGDLFITEGAGHHVSRWTQDGALIQRWADPGPGPSQLQSAWGIAVDPPGFVYVADYAGSRVLKFTADGTFVTSWGGAGSGAGLFGAPTNISIDPTGTILVADPYNNRIEEFTPDGVFLSAWGNPGQAPGEFSEPYGLATFGLDVIVADAGNSRIQKFSYLPTPTSRTTWGRLRTLYR